MSKVYFTNDQLMSRSGILIKVYKLKCINIQDHDWLKNLSKNLNKTNTKDLQNSRYIKSAHKKMRRPWRACKKRQFIVQNLFRQNSFLTIRIDCNIRNIHLNSIPKQSNRFRLRILRISFFSPCFIRLMFSKWLHCANCRYAQQLHTGFQDRVKHRLFDPLVWQQTKRNHRL